MARVFVDADACPVKGEAERVATRHGVPMVLVCNGGIRPSENPLVTLRIVDEGPDAADRWIADHCGPGDVVVTGDLPLADRCIRAGAAVIGHNGAALSAANIGPRLANRDLMRDIRAADPFHQGGGAAFSKADRARFLQALDRALGQAQSAVPSRAQGKAEGE
ncbi:MAG: YaiI/YqxD family protein [Pseudomonadota bacterium]